MKDSLDQDFIIDDMTAEQAIAKLLAGEKVEVKYQGYGHGTADKPVGKIILELKADPGAQVNNLNIHNAGPVGDAVEKYILSAEYKPTETELGADDWHTGSFGTKDRGKEAEDKTKNNTHIINVFAKKMKIEKADQTGSIITGDTATFILYRKATQAELNDNAVSKTTLSGMDGQYVAVQTLTTDGGVVTTDVLLLLADNEPYYLVETKAPAGYNMLIEPLKVTIDMTGHNTWTKIVDNTTSQEKPNPYALSNWLQEATIKLWKLDGTAYDPMHTSTYNHNNDTTDASVTYRIINNAGYELPSTGGPGTTIFYAAGIALIALAAFLLLRRKERESL